MQTLKRLRSSAATPQRGAAGRPVLLATLGVPFEETAASFAVECAVETGQPLVLVNAVELVMGPTALVFAPSWEMEDDADAAALAAPAQLAASLGVKVERLRVCSPHPIAALVEVVHEREAGLLVFGPSRTRLRPRRYRKAANAVRERCACLVWLPE